MRVDINRGDLEYHVNGRRCAAIQGVDEIKEGVYLAVQLFNPGTLWRIVSVDGVGVVFD
jgi:hypothetical protein